jgi:thiol-disulfide isomerase/thioredoxin
MKILLNSILTIFCFCLFGNVQASEAPKEINVLCRIQNCPGDSVSIYQFDGIVFNRVKIIKATIADRNVYKFTLPKASAPQFYFIGSTLQDLRVLLLGTEDNVELEGNCFEWKKVLVKNSKLNNIFDGANKRVNLLAFENEELIKSIQLAQGDEVKVKKYEAELLAVDKRKVHFLDSITKVNSFVGKHVALSTYYSFQNNKKAEHTDEIDYYAKEFFHSVDFKDAAYGDMPSVFESFRTYTNTLNTFGLPDERHKEYLEKTLSRIPKGNRTYKYALGGIITSLIARNHANLIAFGDRYCDMYNGEEPGVTGQLKAYLEQRRTFITGIEAPNFTANTPEDKPLSLKDLRGKVLLVDFWASWCGPCRRENPNVVLMYNKYHAKGFEILSVSLDSDKSRWLGAIQQDGLIWNHVSDLKGWQNDAAKLYAVTSIPQTILLDKDGKIIARNLRGEALGEALKNIFGE